MNREPLVFRRLSFGFEREAPATVFYADDLFLSTFWGALSLLFPEGERFFVESVKHYASRIEDPELRARITGFAGQESMHAKEHEVLNGGLFVGPHAARAARAAEGRLEKILARARRRLPSRYQLGATCALEHFTATLAEQLLTIPEHEDAIEGRSRKLWLWHALEEIEHKAVAFDVFEAAGGTYRQRVVSMMFATAMFVAVLGESHARLVLGHVRDGRARELSPRRFARVMLGRPGLFWRLLPTYFDYYRRDFHPDDHDTRELVARWRERLFGADGVLAGQVISAKTVEPRASAA